MARFVKIVFALLLLGRGVAFAQGFVELRFRVTGGDDLPLSLPAYAKFTVDGAQAFSGQLNFPIMFAPKIQNAGIHISADETSLGQALFMFVHTGTEIGQAPVPTYFIYTLETQITAEQHSALLAGHWWVNVTTTDYPESALRGQIMPVPEPETWALLGVGVAAVCVGVRKRVG